MNFPFNYKLLHTPNYDAMAPVPFLFGSGAALDWTGSKARAMRPTARAEFVLSLARRPANWPDAAPEHRTGLCRNGPSSSYECVSAPGQGKLHHTGHPSRSVGSLHRRLEDAASEKSPLEEPGGVE